MGTTTLAGHTAFEEYRYDALGRRVWTRVRRWCDDTQGAGGGADAVACQVSTVRRTVWNGNQELAEIQMPATDSTASSTIENDTLAITRTVPGTGDSFYDANRLYGQVLYVDGLETDQPLAITRNHYADASSTTGSETYAVYAPFSVIPLWNSQGRADRSVVGGTAAPGQDGVCVDGGVTRCASVYLDLGVFPYARTGASMGSWNGTLLIDKADATGTYYRRNRSYDPATARFTQEDPIGLAGGLNAYGFASGDPANYGDPFGLCPWCALDEAIEAAPELEEEVATAGESVLGATERFGNAVSNATSSALNRIDSSLQSIRSQVNNIVGHVGDREHLRTAAQENNGTLQIAKPDGGVYNHVKETRDAMQGLSNSITRLNKILGNPNLSTELRKHATNLLSKASKSLDAMERVFR